MTNFTFGHVLYHNSSPFLSFLILCFVLINILNILFTTEAWTKEENVYLCVFVNFTGSVYICHNVTLEAVNNTSFIPIGWELYLITWPSVDRSWPGSMWWFFDFYSHSVQDYFAWPSRFIFALSLLSQPFVNLMFCASVSLLYCYLHLVFPIVSHCKHSVIHLFDLRWY